MNVTAVICLPRRHTVGGDYYHGTRRTFATTNVNLLDVPPNLQQISGYADNNSNSFNKQNDFSRITSTRHDEVLHWHGQHAVKVAASWSASATPSTTASRTRTWRSTGTRRAHARASSVRGTYGYYR
jgi:hypothetical protein